MPLPLDWRTDPIVQIEDLLIPVLSGAAETLLAAALGVPDRQAVVDWAGQLGQLSVVFETGAATYIGPAGFHLGPEEKARCARAALDLREFEALHGRAMAGDAEVIRDALQALATSVRPNVVDGLNAIREVFIGGVLRRQAQHATMTDRAIGELADVSQSILFISVNASIEAARAGDPGRGFGVIAGEIRTLAQSAQSTINTLQPSD